MRHFSDCILIFEAQVWDDLLFYDMHYCNKYCKTVQNCRHINSRDKNTLNGKLSERWEQTLEKECEPVMRDTIASASRLWSDADNLPTKWSVTSHMTRTTCARIVSHFMLGTRFPSGRVPDRTRASHTMIGAQTRSARIATYSGIN